MADNTFNFDLDAPAVPTLTLDPVEAPAAEEKQPEPAAAPEAEQVKLSPEEQAMVDAFAQKIDITNSQQVLQYGSACQKKIGDFSEAALSKVSTKDLGEVGGMITDLIGELKNFDAAEEEKGILGFFKKKGNQLDNMKTKYSKAETNVETIQSALEKHQVQLLKDIAMPSIVLPYCIMLALAIPSGIEGHFSGMDFNVIICLHVFVRPVSLNSPCFFTLTLFFVNLICVFLADQSTFFSFKVFCRVLSSLSFNSERIFDNL